MDNFNLHLFNYMQTNPKYFKNISQSLSNKPIQETIKKIPTPNQT